MGLTGLRSHLPKMGELGDSLKCVIERGDFQNSVSHDQHAPVFINLPSTPSTTTPLCPHSRPKQTLAIALLSIPVINSHTMSCPDCIMGAVHEGASKGTVSTIAKLPTYIAKPT